MSTSATDATESGRPRREDDVTLLARSVADALKDSVAELRKDEETRISLLTAALRGDISALREGEEARVARLEKAIANWKPEKVEPDPTTNFWTVYKEVADEYDNQMMSRYVTELDNSLLFATLFSAISTAFIIQIIPELQPDPADLTNFLLLHILQQNTSFGGADPLKPISNISHSAVQAQSILLASLSLTLFVAFLAVLGKQWVLYYRATSWGNVTNRGEERQTKLVGLQKWRLKLVMELLPVLLQLALLLFAIALVVYLRDVNAPVARVLLVATIVGTAFYVCITALATFYRDCPFQTPLSVRLQNLALWVKEFTAPARVWLRQKVTITRSKVEGMIRILINKTNTPDQAGEGTPNDNDPTTLLDPILWRNGPLFACPQEDVAASAGFWLLENSTSTSAASAVTAVFSRHQWPSSHPTQTVLVRLHGVYMECVQAPDFKESSYYLKALQSAAAYYVLYHTQFIWDALNRVKGGTEKLPPDLPPDLLRLHNDKWGGDDVFEHLLRIKDRSKPYLPWQFLAHIAPYWVCGDSDGAITFRQKRLWALGELIEALKESKTMNPRTLTDCILSVGVAVGFPVHPDDLIRVDKSDYLVQTLEAVVEHIHGLAIVRGRRHHAKNALEVIVPLVETSTLPLVDAAWIRKLLDRATGENMSDDMFTLFLRLSARRNEEGVMVDVEIPPGQGHTNIPAGAADPEYALLVKILQNVRICSGQDCVWRYDAVYGGLIAIKDIPRLEYFIPDNASLGTLIESMEESKPFRVRKVAYDIIAVAREQWLRSPGSHQILGTLDFPRKLHGIAIKIGRSDYQRSFLMMIEILSAYENWHSYLRETMEIWLPFRHEGQSEVLRTIIRIGGLPQVEHDGSNHSFDQFLENLMQNEWANVPARPMEDLTTESLGPLLEVTMQLMGIFTARSGPESVLHAVKQVIPSLERRRDEDIHDAIEGLKEMLQAGTNAIESPG